MTSRVAGLVEEGEEVAHLHIHGNGNGTANGGSNSNSSNSSKRLSGSQRQKGGRKPSSPMMPAFMVSAPGKVIVFGEHAVVHGKVRPANPLPSSPEARHRSCRH